MKSTKNAQVTLKEATATSTAKRSKRTAVPSKAKKVKRIVGSVRERNQSKILKAAEAVFAEKGFDGATTAEIAARAGVPKANVHYYFGTKQQLYDRLIENILEVWLDALDVIRADAEPAQALGEYIERKVHASRDWPDSSRVWAIEIIGGGRNVSAFLKGRLRQEVREKGKVLAKWAHEGRMDPVDPAHFMFLLWAMTQTYADFAAQIAAVLAKDRLNDKVFQTAEETIKSIILKGCGIKQEKV